MEYLALGDEFEDALVCRSGIRWEVVAEVARNGAGAAKENVTAYDIV